MKLVPLGRLDEPGRILHAALAGELLCVMVGRVDATFVLCARLERRRLRTLWRQPLPHAPGAALALWATPETVGVVAGTARRVLALSDGRVLAEAAGAPPIAAVTCDAGAVLVPGPAGLERVDARSLASAAVALERGDAVAGAAGGGFLPLAGRSGRALLRLADGAHWALPDDGPGPCGLPPVSDGVRVALPLGRPARAPTALVVLEGGAVSWRADLLGDLDPETLPPVSPLVDDGVVHVAGAGCVIESRTLDEGTPLWASPLGVPATALAVQGGTLWVGCSDGTLTAFDAFAGERLGTRSVRARPGLLGARRDPLDAAEHPVWLGASQGGVLCACRLGAVWRATA